MSVADQAKELVRMLSTYGKHPNYARCGDRFVVCAYTYRAWTPEEWRAPFGGSARRRKRTTAPSALSRRETWCASGSFAAARDDERIRAGKIQNVLDYIWKKIQLSLPPLAEQRAIVAKVEELFAVFDAMKGEAAK